MARVEGFVARALQCLSIPSGSLILVAVSGGPDSIALLHAMCAVSGRAGLRVAVAHFNHRLRSAESDRDEMFVRALCDKLEVGLFVGHGTIDAKAGNLEERARELRYEFLNRAAGQSGARHIALGHHADDQAETVLIRLMRGAGTAGLAAMAEAGPGRLIRPMLSLTRDELHVYLKAIGAQFVSDSSNDSSLMLRNRVRNELLPAIGRHYAPGFSRRLVELASDMRLLHDLVGGLAERELNDIAGPGAALDLARLALLHPTLSRAVIRAFIERRAGTLRRIGRVHIEAIRRLCKGGPPGGRIELPGGWRAVRRYGQLTIVRDYEQAAAAYAVPIADCGRTAVPEAGFIFEAATLVADAAEMPENCFKALFDADRSVGRLVVRSFAPGDRIAPLGMAGSRKVKEVFIDRKVPRSERACYPLVTVGGAIAWIPGLMRGRVALFEAETRKVLRLSAFPVAR